MKNITQVCNKDIYPERIIQFGEGNFLRAFVNWITDTMNKQDVFNGSSVVVQPIKQGMAKELNAQNGLYTLYLRGIKDKEPVSEHIIIESISKAINPYESPLEYEALAINPESRFIISNTTEAGIIFNAEDKLQDIPQGSFPAKITAMLYKRYTHFNGDASKGFIFLPCELIDKNGEKLKESILDYIKLWRLEDEFKAWVCEYSVFCNTLVDRIVPGYPRERMAEIIKELGYEDNLVLEAEQFHLWVIEYQQKNGELPKKLVFSLAALMAFYKGNRGTNTIDLQDDEDILELYKGVWADYDNDEIKLKKVVEQVLAYKKNWKMDLNEVKGLKEQVTLYLALILEQGMEKAITQIG